MSRLNIKEKEKLWDDMANSFHSLSSRSKAHKDKYFTISKIITELNPKSVLDLGCGSGLLENELIKLGYSGKITAIDGSSKMLKIAKGLCGNKVKFIKSNFDSNINLNEKSDVIVAINILFFLKDKSKFLKDVSNLLINKDSVFILINPKPNRECSNWQFIKAHFSETSFKEKILIFFNELINIPRYYRMVKGQLKLSKMAEKGQIIFDDKESIKKLADSANLEIKITEDIHAGQNWLFIMRKI